MSSNSVEPRNHKELETIECCHPSADRQCACVWASRVPVTIAPSSGVCLIIALGRCISSIPAVSLLSDAPHKRRLVQLVIYSIAIDRVTIKKYLPAICLCVRVCVSLTDWRGKKIIGDLSIISAPVFVSCVCVCQCVAVLLVKWRMLSSQKKRQAAKSPVDFSSSFSAVRDLVAPTSWKVGGRGGFSSFLFVWFSVG